MPIIAEPKASEQELVLGDYVTVHVSGVRVNPGHNTAPCDMQVHREEFFQRISKQRGEFLRRTQKQKGKLIDVRHSGAA